MDVTRQEPRVDVTDGVPRRGLERRADRPGATFLTGGVSGAPALISSDGRIVTYGELTAATAREPVWLAQGPADRSLVLMAATPTVDFVLAYLGALRHGHPVVPVSPGLDGAALDRLLHAFRPEVLVRPSAASAAPNWPDVPDGYRPATPHGSLLVHVRSGPDVGPLHPDLALVLLTSGTTGRPQGVRLSWKNLHRNAASIRQSLGITAADRAVTALPLHYSYGLSVLHSHLYAGASIVLSADNPIGGAFWRTCAEREVSSFAGVPLTYEGLRGPLRRAWPATLRTLTQAGGRLRPDLVRWYADLARERGARFFVMYGQTEATARMSCVDVVADPAGIGSAGRAIPDGRFEIRPLRPDASGDVGEVVYAGPNVMMGYAADRTQLADGDELGGVLPTGDVGRLRDGYLELTGRIKRIAKTGGRRVNLDELEESLAADARVAVIARDERLVVFHAGDPPATLRSALDRACRALGVPVSHVTVRMLDRVPTTSTNKVDYAALAALAALDEVPGTR
ncbi:AMP-binding protein [Micromonospora sp. NPDC050397]|uniref:AMP-binding protein n=1 Tax=Micromonospora sp. NPDC050397 TaxID=3364279 RepID=UPI00384EF0CA